MKRVPLKRSTKPLRRTPLLRKVGLAARSLKRKREEARYRRWRNQALRGRTCDLRWADGCLWERISAGHFDPVEVLQVHHILKRSQGAPLIPENGDWVPVCVWCHRKIDLEPAEAKRRRFVRSQWAQPKEAD